MAVRKEALAGAAATDRTISAMVRTLMVAQSVGLETVAQALKLQKPSASERLTCKTPWKAHEVDALATLFSVDAGVFYKPTSTLWTGPITYFATQEQLSLFSTEAGVLTLSDAVAA